MKKRTLAMLFAAALSVTLFAGCGVGGSDGTSGTAQVTINSAADLAGKKIAVQEGTTGDILVSDMEGTQVSRFKKATDCAMELINGRVDAVVIDNMPAKKLVDANSKKLKLLDFPASEDKEAYAIAIAKGNTELLDQFNTAIKTLKSNGTYDALVDKYISGNADAKLPDIPDYTATKTLIMGTNAEFEPFEYRTDDNQVVGFDVELAKYICAQIGVKLEVSDQDFDSLIPALETGKINFIAAGMSATDERKKNVDFTDDYYEATQAIVVRK